jgi:hypothetical protein
MLYSANLAFVFGRQIDVKYGLDRGSQKLIHFHLDLCDLLVLAETYL